MAPRLYFQDVKKFHRFFEVPFSKLFQNRAGEVLNQTGESKEHQKKVEEANLEYPIDIMKNKDKWLVLDGLHRLAKAYKLGHKKIKVRIISPEKIREVTI